MKSTIAISALLILALTTTQVFSFHSLGHMTVAAIAEFHLKKSSLGTQAWQWATDLITPFSDVCGELEHPFIECATWPDKIKDQGWFMMFNWHFADERLAADDFVLPEETTTDENVVWAIDKASYFLSSTKKDFSGRSKELLGKSIEIRNLIHWVGDIHQPLHTVSRFSKALPDGDQGGNLFKIKHYDTPSWNNLHFIWDHIFDLPEKPTPTGGDLWSPLNNNEEWEYLKEFTLSLMDENKYESLSQQMKDKPKASDWTAVNIYFPFIFGC